MSDSGFVKRVELLEHWAPSLLSKLKDLDDLADCILSVWDTAEAHTEQRIIKLLDEMPDDYWTRLGGFANKVDRAELIELIKGETNEPK